MNPHATADAALIEAIGRGEFSINGFRNRDLRRLLFTDASASKPDARLRPSPASCCCCARIT
jgi:hypothetical protein